MDTEQYVIVTIYRTIIHVWGDPAWNTRQKAILGMTKMQREDRKNNPDKDPAEVQYKVRKILGTEPGPMVEVRP